MTQIGMGAEAVLIRVENGILKIRPPKAYRHPTLDTELRVGRTKREAKILEKAKHAGIPVPNVQIIDDTTVLLSEIKGVPVKEVLDQYPLLAHQIGRLIAKLHAADIIHADLTTSNMLHDKENNHTTIIDFGLSFVSKRDEDKAVDLHLFHQSLESKHHIVSTFAYRHFLKGYRDTASNAPTIIERLRQVEARGRNKEKS